MGRKPIRTIKRNSRSNGSGSNESGTVNSDNLRTADESGESSAGEPGISGTDTTGGNLEASVGVDGNGAEFVDPASASGDSDGDSSGRKRRGRPRGSSSKRTSTTQATADISRILFSLHLGMAKFLKSDVLALSEEESQELGAAITRVTDLYDIRILPEKYMAWINLAVVGGGIYGPRLIVANMKKKPASVIVMPSPPVPDAPLNPTPGGAA